MLGHEGHTAGGAGNIVAVGLLDTHTKDVFGSGPICSQDLRTHVPVPLTGALYPVSWERGMQPSLRAAAYAPLPLARQRAMTTL